MEHKDYFSLGYISKTIGNNGELTVVLDTDQPDNYKNLSSLFVDIKGTLIPYQIKKIILKGNKANIFLQDVDTTEKAAFLCGCSLHLPLNFLPKLKGKKFYFHEVIGFEIEDESHGKIGKIKSIIDQSSQAIFQIDHEGNEILIPIIDEFIQKVDRKKKLIFIQSPEGLIDIYLEQKNINT